MKILSIMDIVTMGDARRIRPIILWTMLEYAVRGVPYGILLTVVWELFKPLQNPGTELNVMIIIGLCIALLVSLILLFIVSKIAFYKNFCEGYDIGAEGRLHIGQHLRKMPMSFFNSHDPGSIGSYLIRDYGNIEYVLTHILPQLVGSVVMPLVLLIFLAFQSWQLALISALVIPLALPLSKLSKLIIVYFGKKHHKAQIDASSRTLEYIYGIRDIKAFNLTGVRFDRMEKTFRHLKSMSIKLEAGSGPTVIFGNFVLHGGFTLIILFGLTFLFKGSLPLPVYITFLILGARVYEPLLQALIFTAMLNYYEVGINRIENLRNTPILTGEENTDKPHKFDIEFVNCSFRYHERNVLDHVSFQIPENSLCALVGPSGAGKTTITRIIARFWDVTEGVVKIGGKDIKTYHPDDLLASISVVFQDVYLFNDSILNNIRLGRQSASLEDIVEASKKARCHEFIESLPQGYETIVGEGGSTLSGGEKQRISIARAILKDAPIILLDEATASLDPENELYLQEALSDLIRDKTVVVIAHRLNTVVRADCIFVLDGGTVIEQGTHEQLLDKNGLYQHMWSEQQSVRGWKF